MPNGIPRLAALAGLIALLLGGALVARPALGGKGDETAPALALAAPLPSWRAPGGRLLVRGRAAPLESVTLRAGRRVLGRATAGPRGRFRLDVRAPSRPGRYRLVLHGRERQTFAGTLRVRPLVLAAVGDVNLGDRTAVAIAGHGADYPWTAVAPVLRGADLAVANLECAVSGRGAPAAGKEYTFRGPPAALRALARAGLDAVTVANNHSLDFGRDAFLDTLRLARAARLGVAGGGADLTAARRPVLLAAGGLTIALLGYSDVRPLGFDAGTGLPGAAPAFPELIDPDVRAARRRADLVVVYFHWGDELATAPSARQSQLAGTAFAAGATAVLGAHPHVLQPVERVGARRLAAWSLGNFVFAAASPGTSRTGILLVRLGRDGVRGARLVPARIEGVRPVLERDAP
jgi:poly-gamma-glutamate capsule biosynthesis protein CapA/YwtB (metallophosphatase superfamily)